MNIKIVIVMCIVFMSGCAVYAPPPPMAYGGYGGYGGYGYGYGVAPIIVPAPAFGFRGGWGFRGFRR
ncbi:MAG: hypothetical protein PHW13_06830 [Methylococcales bacterium]|nr:hypothetical protein [Methylococcales bacterium]